MAKVLFGKTSMEEWVIVKNESFPLHEHSQTHKHIDKHWKVKSSQS